MLTQQALTAEQHVAVEKRIGQRVVRVVRRAGALVDVLSDEIQFQVAADFRAGPTTANAVQNDFLGGVQRRNNTAVLLRQLQAAGLHVEGANRLEQRRFEFQVLPQFAEQPRQRLLHRLVGKQHLPQHRQQAVPGSACHQQHRLVPEVQHLTAALIDADHGVDRENQRAVGNRAIALAQRAEHGQAEAGQRQ